MEIFKKKKKKKKKKKRYSQERIQKKKSQDLKSPDCRQNWPSSAYTFRLEYLNMYNSYIVKQKGLKLVLQAPNQIHPQSLQ